MNHAAGTDLTIVMLGATGAVGGFVASALQKNAAVSQLTLLGRRSVSEMISPKVKQHQVDIMNPESYRSLLRGHRVAICTLGVGQPSKISKAEFIKIDKDAVLDFATGCRESGVSHFQLLSSVGTSASSRSFYLRTKGELEEGLREMGFDRLSLFQPSMILTPQNRYGILQGVTLKIWPALKPLLIGPLRQFRGIAVDRLGHAIAENTMRNGTGVETLHWDEFVSLTAR